MHMVTELLAARSRHDRRSVVSATVFSFLFFVLVTAASADGQTGCGGHGVVIIVDPALVTSIRSGLDQFEKDLCVGGYDVVEHASGFSDPVAVRAYLAEQYAVSNGGVEGAILIGNIPHAYQWVTLVSTNPNFPPESEEVISFQYYADLNGDFAKSVTYVSPGGHAASYDVHTGDVDWEIWIGVLPLYNGSLAQSADAINRYFAKNHAFRYGQLVRPSVFLEVNEHFYATTTAESDTILSGMREGIYSWTPYSNAAGARLYFNSVTGLSVQQGYTDLQNGVADFTVQDSHGYWGAAGQLTIAFVETTPIRTLFYWSNGCAVGNLDQVRNVLTSFLYSYTSEVLVAKGTTNNSGGMGNTENGFFGHNVATGLGLRDNFGKAVIGHVNASPLLWPWSMEREFLFATTVILGDPTLRHRYDNAPRYRLRVGSLGNGRIESDPPGISCGRVCENRFYKGTEITLTAADNSDYSFAGWSGACTGSGPCTITINADADVMAHYAGTARAPLAIALSRPTRGVRSQAVPVVLAGSARAVAWTVSVKAAAGATVELTCDAPDAVVCSVSPERVEQKSGADVQVKVSISAARSAQVGERSAKVRARTDRDSTSIDVPFNVAAQF